MGVCAGESERADSRDARPVGTLPGGRLLDHLYRKPVPRNVRRRVLKVQVLRQQAVLQREDDLDDARDAGGCLQVADVGLDRAHQQRLARVAAGAEHGTRGLGLDRVAEGRPGAVCLQVADVAGCEARTCQCIGDDPLLSDAVGHGQATRCPVLVDRAAANDGPNPVTVANRVLEPLDHDHPATLTTHIAVRGRVERLASAVWREHVRTGERDHGGRCEQDVRAAGQREVAFAQLQRLARLMDCHQGRTACRVDGDGRTL